MFRLKVRFEIFDKSGLTAVTFSLCLMIPSSLHPPDVVVSSHFFFLFSVFCFVCSCPPSVVVNVVFFVVVVSSKKKNQTPKTNSPPVEETSLGYVSRFAMVSLFFSFFAYG